MDVRRRGTDEGPVVLLKCDPLEFAILAEAVKHQYEDLKEAFRRDINQFSDPVYTSQLFAVMRVMIKEME